jgi:hypothetical protein
MLEQYVNDRPYVASSFLSVAIADVLGSALSGKSKSMSILIRERLVSYSPAGVAAPLWGEDFLLHPFLMSAGDIRNRRG